MKHAVKHAPYVCLAKITFKVDTYKPFSHLAYQLLSLCYCIMKRRYMAPRRISIGTYDRAQALIRNNEYRKDLEALGDRSQEAKKTDFFTKYRLNERVIDEELLKRYDRVSIESVRLFTDQAVRIVPSVTDTHNGSYPHEESDHGPAGRRWLRDGTCLALEIDLSKEPREILDKLRSLIKMMIPAVRAGADGQVNEEPDPWVVYDLRKREYLTFSEIARRLSGEKGSISGNKRLHAFYIKVKRAYQKAEHLIDSVFPRD